jgi:hypothetical protein
LVKIASTSNIKASCLEGLCDQARIVGRRCKRSDLIASIADNKRKAFLGAGGAGLRQRRRSGAATALSAALSATAGARLSVGVAWGGADAGTRMEAFCNKMAPNTPTHSTIASADPIAARRMPDLHLGGMDRVS